MTALDRNPATTNYLSSVNFKLWIKRAPNVDFHVQKVATPGLLLQAPALKNPFADIPFGGDQITFESLDLTFLVDENLANYLEIFNWIYAMGGPDDLEESANLLTKPRSSSEGEVSEIILSILDSAKNAKFHFNFHDCVPTSLSGFEMNNAVDDVTYVTASASFKIRSYDISLNV